MKKEDSIQLGKVKYIIWIPKLANIPFDMCAQQSLFVCLIWA